MKTHRDDTLSCQKQLFNQIEKIENIMSDSEQYHDNPNGVITDKKMDREWLPKDAYGDLGKWTNFREAQSYILTMRGVYAGGFNDWRLPTAEEAQGLYNEDLKQLDWEGLEVHIHPAFVPKCSRYIWTSEENDEGQARRVDLQNGSSEFIDKETREHQSVRLVRDPSRR